VLAQRAAQAAAGNGQDAEQANALRLQGRAQSRLGQADAAAASFAAALALDRQAGLPERIALDLLEAAEHERRRSQFGPARDFYERAATVYRASGQPQVADMVQRRLDELPRAVR
jgi:Tfp pilus assembly protein PilF